MTIALADDHDVVRQGLRALIERERGLSVIGEAADGLEAVEMVERLRPQILVLDLMMPGLNGLEVARRVSRRWPQTRVIVFSMYASEAYVLEALRNGASGYVLKEAGASHLLHAIREVAAGRRYLSPPFSDQAVEAYVARSRSEPLDPYDRLTAREREVLHLAAEGRSNREVAQRLSISPRTAETHRATLLRKLGLRNQTELVRYALQRGILARDGDLPAKGGAGAGEPGA